MKTRSIKILSIFLLLALLCGNLLTGALAFASDSFITTTATGYTTASDVDYVTNTVDGKTVVANWGMRGETAMFLTTYAQNFYTGNYAYDVLSQKSGGTSQSTAPSSGLYSALKSMMSSKQSYTTSYDATKKYFRYTDCVDGDYAHISSFYSGKQINGSWDGSWNREHTWPNSKGDASGQGENDIMMLRPTSIQENSSRGNTAYGESSGYFDPDIENPPASVRGDCARIMLFVYTRWGNTGSMWGKSGVMESLSVLLKWMEQDPVDTWEMGRNDAVQSITGTRNVFVDYPELAWQLFGQSVPASMSTPSNGAGNGGSSVTVESITPSTYLMNLTSGQTQKITVTASPSGASNAVTFQSQNTSVATVDAYGNVTAKDSGETQIVVTSKSNENAKAYVKVVVKSATAISVSGTPTKTSYAEGESFNPAGLTVTATYSDGTSATLSSADCQWLDGATNGTTLSQGTTVVVCKYGNLTAVIQGITVSQAVGKTVIIDRNSFSATSGYAFHSWSSDQLKGEAYIYAGTTDKLQFNSSKTAYYLYGTAPTPITKVKVYLQGGGDDWELVTNSVAYDSKTTPTPTAGTSHGTKQVTSSGATWNLAGNTHCHFTLNYKDTGVTYIQKIEITYGTTSEGGGDDKPITPDTVTLSQTTASLEIGQTLTLTASASGNVTWITSNSNVATVVNGKITAVGAGNATITAICGTATATCAVTVKGTQKPDEGGNQDISAFDEAVKAIENGNSLTERYVLIRSAVTIYNGMSSEQKAQATKQIATLKQHVERYNNDVTAQNTAHNSAIDATTVVASVAVLMSALAIALKRYW